VVKSYSSGTAGVSKGTKDVVIGEIELLKISLNVTGSPLREI
jgi:hypothetical protein